MKCSSKERERESMVPLESNTQHDLLYSPKERNSVLISCCWKQSSVYSFIYLTFGRLFLRLASAWYISNFTSPWLCTNVWDQTPEDTPVMTWELAFCSVSQTELGASMQWTKRIFQEVIPTPGWLAVPSLHLEVNATSRKIFCETGTKCIPNSTSL